MNKFKRVIAVVDGAVNIKVGDIYNVTEHDLDGTFHIDLPNHSMLWFGLHGVIVHTSFSISEQYKIFEPYYSIKLKELI